MNILERRSGIFDEERKYRALLRITWDATKPRIAFVGLNPSTADEFADDNTIRRCKGYAYDWGFGELLMVNLFALRATDPKVMLSAADPIGKLGDVGGQLRLLDPNVVVACWGTHGSHRGRAAEVTQQIARYFGGDRFVCLGVNRDGSPKHPLYLRADAKRVPFGVEVQRG